MNSTDKNVNKNAQGPRKRRSPEESRANILAAAENLLVEQGPQALRLAELAKEAGVVHATILHHFGSIQGVHTALMEGMIEDLVERIMALEFGEDRSVSRGFAFETLIEAFDHKGAARLAAWLELTGESQRLTSVRNAVAQVIAKKIQPESISVDQLQDIIMTSVILALGVGLFGSSLETLMDRPEGRAKEMALELLKSNSDRLSGDCCD